MSVEIFRRGADRLAAGWLTDWQHLSATLRRNVVGSWQLTLPGFVEWDPEQGITVERDGGVLFSGNWTRIEHDGGDTGTWQTTVYGDTDLGRVAYRNVFPTPANTWANQTVVTHYAVSATNAEVAMRALVNLNAGPGAQADRQVAGLYLGSLAPAGTLITKQWRFTPLLDALRSAARAGGDLSFDVRDDGSGALEFTVFDPRDRTAEVQVELGMPGVEAISHEMGAPTATRYNIAGLGEGLARKLRGVSDTAALALGWSWAETFLDRRDTDDNTELDNEAADHMVDSGPTDYVGAEILSVEGFAYGTHWALGDRVTVHLPSGARTPVIETVEYDNDVDRGETIRAAIGVSRLLSQPEWQPVFNDTDKRLFNVEAGQ